MTLLTDRDATTTSRTPALTRGDASPATPRHERRNRAHEFDIDAAFTRTSIIEQLINLGPTCPSVILEAIAPEHLRGFARKRALEATRAILDQLKSERLVKYTGLGWISQEWKGASA